MNMKARVKVWEERKRKTVNLRLVTLVDGSVELQAVDADGREAALILTWQGGRCIQSEVVFQALHENGYDTSFAEWDEESGAMLIE
jgi:hypothetical protein